MFFGHHVLAADYTSNGWQVHIKKRQTGEILQLQFDALVLSDKLLIQPNTYSVLTEENAGSLALPTALSSTGAVVMLVALKQSADFPIPADKTVFKAIDYDHWNPKIIERVVHESAKPGRQPVVCTRGLEGLDLWVVHSTAEYAAAHLRGESLDDEAAVLSEMREAFLGPSNSSANQQTKEQARAQHVAQEQATGFVSHDSLIKVRPTAAGQTVVASSSAPRCTIFATGRKMGRGVRGFSVHMRTKQAKTAIGLLSKGQTHGECCAHSLSAHNCTCQVQ
jgi:hypothetical protein